jgi:hypothetical protein
MDDDTRQELIKLVKKQLRKPKICYKVKMELRARLLKLENNDV